MTKWQKKLTKKQREHLKWAGVTSLAGFRRCLDHQNGLRSSTNSPVSICFECTAIFNRLTDAGITV